MLLFEIPKLFNFQRTALQTDLPALSPIPAKQAGLAQAGRGPRGRNSVPVPAWIAHTQLGALHKEVPPPRPRQWSPTSGDTAMKGISGCFHLPAFLRGHSSGHPLQAVRRCSLEMENFELGEGRGRWDSKGKALCCRGFQWHDWVWDL